MVSVPAARLHAYREARRRRPFDPFRCWRSDQFTPHRKPLAWHDRIANTSPTGTAAGGAALQQIAAFLALDTLKPGRQAGAAAARANVAPHRRNLENQARQW